MKIDPALFTPQDQRAASLLDRVDIELAEGPAFDLVFDRLWAAFGPRGEVWYGTVGNGWGLSTDDGRTWTNWTFTQLGPEWQYVAPDGIVVRGDTVWVGTADGVQMTTDDGQHWVAFTDRTGPAARGPADTAITVLGN